MLSGSSALGLVCGQIYSKILLYIFYSDMQICDIICHYEDIDIVILNKIYGWGNDM